MVGILPILWYVIKNYFTLWHHAREARNCVFIWWSYLHHQNGSVTPQQQSWMDKIQCCPTKSSLLPHCCQLFATSSFLLTISKINSQIMLIQQQLMKTLMRQLVQRVIMASRSCWWSHYNLVFCRSTHQTNQSWFCRQSEKATRYPRTTGKYWRFKRCKLSWLCHGRSK